MTKFENIFNPNSQRYVSDFFFLILRRNFPWNYWNCRLSQPSLERKKLNRCSKWLVWLKNMSFVWIWKKKKKKIQSTTFSCLRCPNFWKGINYGQVEKKSTYKLFWRHFWDVEKGKRRMRNFIGNLVHGLWIIILSLCFILFTRFEVAPILLVMNERPRFVKWSRREKKNGVVRVCDMWLCRCCTE